MPALVPGARVVVRTPNWLGDAVMAIPAIAAIRTAWPDASLAIAAPRGMAPLFRERTGARPNEILEIDPHGSIDVLRRGRFDAAILLPNSFRSAWLARGAGIPERWGYASGFRRWMLTRAVPRPAGRVHQAEYYAALVRGLGIEVADVRPRIEAARGSVERAVDLLRAEGASEGQQVVGLAPGAAYGHAKRWPPGRVAELIVRLTREQGVACVLVGAAGDRPAGREIESALPRGIGVIDLIGRTDLRLLVGVLARCTAFVSNDSGAMHLAAAVGVPVSAIFGPTDERVTAPVGDHDVLVHQVFCRPCMLRECPIDHRCMKGITVDAVAASVTRHLAGTSRAADPAQMADRR
jgi:heptosyltransferase-2